MNFLDELSPTRYSSRAAAASAASDAGMFHEYSRVLFEDQQPEGGPGLSDGQLFELGEGIGISDPHFAATIRRGTYLRWPSLPSARLRGVSQGHLACSSTVFPSRPGPATSLRPLSAFALTWQLCGQHIGRFEQWRCLEQVIILFERGRDPACQVGLPAGLIGEGVEDPKRRDAEPNSEPSDGRWLFLNHLQTVLEKFGYFLLLAGLGFQPNQQHDVYHA